MRSRSKRVRASTSLRRAGPIAAICLVAGCSWTGPWQSAVSLPREVTPDGARDRIVAPVTLDTAEVKTGDANALASTDDSVAPQKKVVPASFLTRVPATTPVVASFDASASDAATQTFSLPDAIDFGIRNNPRLVAALAAIERARGQSEVAFSAFLPQVDFLTHEGVTSPTLGPASAGVTGIILPTATATHDYAQAELQLSWTIYDFGHTGGQYHQAQAREQIAELQSTRARQTVGFDVASAYLLALRAGAIRRIQEEAIRRAQATLRDTRSRRAAGVLEKDDVLRAEVQLAAAEEDVDLAQEAELTAVARLNNAMGRNASLPVSLVAWNSEPAFNLSLVQCLEVAASQRAEISIAREAVAASQFGRESVAGDFLPKVYTRGSVGVVGGSNIATGAQEGIGLHIDMPLYTAGRREGSLCAADAEIQQSLADARTILDEVTLQVTVAYIAATTAHRRIERDRPAVVEAVENLRLVRNRYRNGQATPTDIVDAEVALTRAQQRLVSANYEYLGALVALDYSLENPAASLLGSSASPDGKNPQPVDEVLPAPPLPQPEQKH
jgi:outer membrane protein